jgi:hypothetical protein
MSQKYDLPPKVLDLWPKIEKFERRKN